MSHTLSGTLTDVKYLILENIRSAYNVGAIFRTADAAGVTKIFLIGYTPKPIDRFGRPQREIVKTSLGASDTVPWEYFSKTHEAIEIMKQEGVVVVSVEQVEGSVPLKEFIEPAKVAYVVGNEVDGVEQATLAASDVVVELPMLGSKESLNVSVTAGIILYHGLA